MAFEITVAKEKADNYAHILEEKVAQRTREINDSEGHHRGDEILSSVGTALNDICREGDTPARFGGDEFCIILPHTTAENAQPLCARIIADFEQTHDGQYHLSIGIAQNGPDRFLAVEDFCLKQMRLCTSQKRIMTVRLPSNHPLTHIFTLYEESRRLQIGERGIFLP